MVEEDREVHAKSGRNLDSFRAHMLLGTVVSSAALLLLVSLGLFVPLFARLGSGAHLDAEVLLVADRLLFLHENFWPVAVVAMLAPCLSSYVLYRRMTQPLIRVRRVLTEISNGQVPRPLELRSGDYLEAEVFALNSMLESLRSRSRGLESARERLADWVEQIEQLADCDEQDACLEQLRLQHKELDEQLDWLTAPR